MPIEQITETILIPNPTERLEIFGDRELPKLFRELGRKSAEMLNFPDGIPQQSPPAHLAQDEVVQIQTETGAN